MCLDEVLKALPPIVQAASILVTAIFAVKSLRAWRTQLIGKRRFEVAEEIIMAVNRAKDSLSYVRGPLSSIAESADRERPVGETTTQARWRNSHFIVIKRLQSVADDFTNLQKARLLCKAHFGDDAVKHIMVLFQARVEVVVSAEALSEMANNPGARESDPDFYRSCERKIWAIGDDKDVLTSSINKAVEAIEGTCMPYLK